MKRCPFCAEDIQDAAVVCKHCGRDLKSGAWHVHVVRTPPDHVPLIGVGITLLTMAAIVAVVWVRFTGPSTTADPRPTAEIPLTIRAGGNSAPPGRLSGAAGSAANGQPAAATAPLPVDPELRLKALVERVARGASVLPAEKGWRIRWMLSPSRTGDEVREGARRDVVRMLKAVKESGVPYDLVVLDGMFEEIDRFGNSANQLGVSATFKKATMERINWGRESALPANIFEIADKRSIQKAFR